MIFNIATAALTFQNYQQNASNTYIGSIEYGLTITDIVINCLIVFISVIVLPTIIHVVCESYKHDNNDNNEFVVSCKSLCFVTCIIILNGIFNIIYSITVINLYYTQQIVDKQLFNMTVSILVLNPTIFLIFVLGTCVNK